ncbi:hypothetical protein [uncultured Arcobacter sp.]|uniref:hypothetical protein n=1 Tax=uncultured Arcobacter sp. TaxID=165434 RepID=UPI0026156718|nr:hypothetical protein [uncultured Arcobacter sp.]
MCVNVKVDKDKISASFYQHDVAHTTNNIVKQLMDNAYEDFEKRVIESLPDEALEKLYRLSFKELLKRGVHL